MQILRVFNNNVVLARREDGTEVVLTGRGLGFQTRPGQEVDPIKVVRVFEPTDGRDPDTLGGLVAAIPPEHIALAEEALDLVGVPVTATTLVAVADHISFAIKRVHQGIELEMPLRAEVEHLYPRELDRARQVLAHVNSRLTEPLPEDEAVAIAMHLVNAAMMGGDLTETYAMTGIIKQLFEVIESSFGRRFDMATVNAARFITHLRYFLVRVRSDRQLTDEAGPLRDAIRASYPAAYACAQRCRTVLELRLGRTVTEDEVVYLTLHVARLTTEVAGEA